MFIQCFRCELSFTCTLQHTVMQPDMLMTERSCVTGAFVCVCVLDVFKGHFTGFLPMIKTSRWFQLLDIKLKLIQILLVCGCGVRMCYFPFTSSFQMVLWCDWWFLKYEYSMYSLFKQDVSAFQTYIMSTNQLLLGCVLWCYIIYINPSYASLYNLVYSSISQELRISLGLYLNIYSVAYTIFI